MELQSTCPRRSSGCPTRLRKKRRAVKVILNDNYVECMCCGAYALGINRYMDNMPTNSRVEICSVDYLAVDYDRLGFRTSLNDNPKNRPHGTHSPLPGHAPPLDYQYYQYSTSPVPSLISILKKRDYSSLEKQDKLLERRGSPCATPLSFFSHALAERQYLLPSRLSHDIQSIYSARKHSSQSLPTTLPSLIKSHGEREDRIKWVDPLNCWVEENENPMPYLNFVNNANLCSKGYNIGEEARPYEKPDPEPCDRFLSHMHMHTHGASAAEVREQLRLEREEKRRAELEKKRRELEERNRFRELLRAKERANLYKAPPQYVPKKPKVPVQKPLTPPLHKTPTPPPQSLTPSLRSPTPVQSPEPTRSPTPLLEPFPAEDDGEFNLVKFAEGLMTPTTSRVDPRDDEITFFKKDPFTKRTYPEQRSYSDYSMLGFGEKVIVKNYDAHARYKPEFLLKKKALPEVFLTPPKVRRKPLNKREKVVKEKPPTPPPKKEIPQFSRKHTGDIFGDDDFSSLALQKEEEEEREPVKEPTPAPTPTPEPPTPPKTPTPPPPETPREETPLKKRRGKKLLDKSLEDELRRQRLAEQRRKKAQLMAERLRKQQTTNTAADDEDGSANFDDYSWLAKYCILNKGNLEMYQMAFEAVDEDGDGILNFEEIMLGLRGVNRGLSDTEEEYLYRVLELSGYRVTDGADFKLFSVICALSQRISSVDKWIRNLIGRVDFKILELKMFMCKRLWECNVDPETNTIPIRQVMVELRAGGISLEHEQEVFDKLHHLFALDLLDFLTYIPLFIMIHLSVVNNPLDDSRVK